MPKIPSFLLPACVLIVLASVACAKDSSDLSTREISAAFTVTVNDQPAPGNTVVEATLKQRSLESGSVDPVNLNDGDTLSIVTDKGDDLQMLRVALGLYRATLDNVDRTKFTWKLRRSTGSAENSTITMPAPMAFTEPAPNKAYAATDKVHIAWSNSSKGAELKLAATHRDCSSGISVGLGDSSVKDIPFDDDGSLDIEVTKLYSGTPKSGDCVDIAIEREINAPADETLAGGSTIYATRTDRLTIKVQ
jgi:hypothetical protein